MSEDGGFIRVFFTSYELALIIRALQKAEVPKDEEKIVFELQQKLTAKLKFEA